MPLLRPGIGKEDVEGGEGSVRYHALEDLEGVVLHDADVGKTPLLDLAEEAPTPAR
jgi:hypothetical protein